jgi:hypothetical protein
MADSIKFTNVSFAGGKFAQDTLEFNYPPSPPPGKTTYAEFKGSLSFTASNGSKVEFKEFVISCSASAPNVYHLESVGPNGELLQLSWTGTTPTSFDGGTAVLDGEIYDKFVDNSITPTVCFAAGTLIRTPVGDVAVETLKAGDLVVTASGEMRAVQWMGHADIDEDNDRSSSFSSVLFGLYFGLLVWGGLYLRHGRLRKSCRARQLFQRLRQGKRQRSGVLAIR